MRTQFAMAQTCLIVLLPLGVQTGRIYEQQTLITDFKADVEKATRSSTKIVTMDVGANDGEWTRTTVSPILARARHLGLSVHAYLVEPQPILHAKLAELAARMGDTTVVPAAAWTANTTLEFPKQGASKSASLISGRGVASSDAQVDLVPAIDLAEFIKTATRRSTEGERVISLLKLDLEGAEYTIFPWLFSQGALCHATYLLIEWHLGTAEPERRLAGLGMRLAFDSMLHHGCVTPPLAVLHDEFPGNNLDVPIPGLLELARQREVTATGTSQWARDKRKKDHQHFAALQAVHAASSPQLLSKPRIYAAAGARPRCYGACPTTCFDDRRFVNFTIHSYDRQVDFQSRHESTTEGRTAWMRTPGCLAYALHPGDGAIAWVPEGG